MARKKSKDLPARIKQAEKLLPTIERCILHLQVWQNAMEILEETEIEVEEESDEIISAVTGFNKDYHLMCYQFYKTLNQLLEMGCIVRDLEEGLVDIKIDVLGATVNLSWRLGEKKIEYWHDPIFSPSVRHRIISLPDPAASQKIPASKSPDLKNSQLKRRR